MRGGRAPAGAPRAGGLCFVAGVGTRRLDRCTKLVVARSHQANGALLLGLAMAVYVWVKRVYAKA